MEVQWGPCDACECVKLTNRRRRLFKAFKFHGPRLPNGDDALDAGMGIRHERDWTTARCASSSWQAELCDSAIHLSVVDESLEPLVRQPLRIGRPIAPIGLGSGTKYAAHQRPVLQLFYLIIFFYFRLQLGSVLFHLDPAALAANFRRLRPMP